MSKPDLSTYGGRLRDLGYAGQIVDTNPATIESKTNEAATAIDFGAAVARGAADDTCKAPAADGDKIIGISVRHAIRPADSSGNVTYAQKDSVPIMRSGYVYATAYENATRGDGVISVTAQSGKLGSTTGGAAGVGRVAVPNAIWETTTTAGQIGIVRISG
ncbi:MAG: structural cement protein Gp24 [Thiobacillus sp.]